MGKSFSLDKVGVAEARSSNFNKEVVKGFNFNSPAVLAFRFWALADWHS